MNRYVMMTVAILVLFVGLLSVNDYMRSGTFFSIEEASHHEFVECALASFAVGLTLGTGTPKMRKATLTGLLTAFLCLASVGTFIAVFATGTSINLSYSTNDGTTLSQTVTILTANGTLDATLQNGPTTWNGTKGINLNMYTGNQWIKTPVFTFPNLNGVVRYEMNFTLAAGGSNPVLFQKGVTGANGYLVQISLDTGTSSIRFYYSNATNSYQTAFRLYITVPSVNYNITVVANYTSGVAYGYANGVLGTNGTMTNANYPSSTGALAMGSGVLGGNYINGTIYDADVSFSTSSYVQGGNSNLAEWKFDEGSGSVVYGYGNLVTLTTTPTATLVSQTASAVNSSIIDTSPFPISNTTDQYTAASGFFDRVNSSTAKVLTLTNNVYLTFANDGHGVANQTTGWFATLQTVNTLATPNLGYALNEWTNGVGGVIGTKDMNPLSFYVTAYGTIAANFTTPLAATSASTFDLATQWIIFLVALLFMGLTFFYHDTDEQSSPITNGLGIIRFLLFPILSAILFALFAGMALVSLNYGATFGWTLFTLGFVLALIMVIVTIAIVLIATGKIFRDAATSKGKLK
jgi:hypothetical protein